MKNNLSRIQKGSLILAMLCPLVARSQQDRLYLKADLGGNITHSTELREFFGEDVAGAKVKFDPGLRIGIAAGYELCKWFAVEGEVGALENRIKSITGATRLDDAYFGNVPFLLNARFQAPKEWKFSPYIGGGVGGAASIIDIDHLEIGDTRVHGNDADVVFAYQGFTGFRIALNDRMGLGFEYRYFRAEKPTWKSNDDFDTGGADRMKFGRAETHAFSVVFDWHF